MDEDEAFLGEQTGCQILFSKNLDQIPWKESVHKYAEMLLSTFLKIYFESMCMWVWVCVGVYVCECSYLWRPEGSTRFPRAGVLSDCEPPHMGYKSNKCS